MYNVTKFKFSIHQRILKKSIMVSSRMNFEGSLDTDPLVAS